MTSALGAQVLTSTVPFTIAVKYICLRLNLTQDVKAFHDENYETLVKEAEGDKTGKILSTIMD